MITALHELEVGQEADFFALLAEKELLKAKNGKPYLRVCFRDAYREVRFPVWQSVPIYPEFKTLKTGDYCKIRAVYKVTQGHGAELDLHKIRLVNEDDIKDGFDPLLLREKSPLVIAVMFDELQEIANKELGKSKLHQLTAKILKDHRAALQSLVGSRKHHHSYVGGLLEHTLSVTKIALALLNHYETMYPKRRGEISRPLTIAAAILHDIGKIKEYELELGSLNHSLEGELAGHAVLGRDIVHEAAETVQLETPLRIRLEHIILSHQRYPDWGAAKPPMSLEAMIVHHADSCDALVGCFQEVFAKDETEHELTNNRNVLGYPLLKPLTIVRGSDSLSEPRPK
jgi:3'-5' exoribonuclease